MFIRMLFISIQIFEKCGGLYEQYWQWLGNLTSPYHFSSFLKVKKFVGSFVSSPLLMGNKKCSYIHKAHLRIQIHLSLHKNQINKWKFILCLVLRVLFSVVFFKEVLRLDKILDKLCHSSRVKSMFDLFPEYSPIHLSIWLTLYSMPEVQ